MFEDPIVNRFATKYRATHDKVSYGPGLKENDIRIDVAGKFKQSARAEDRCSGIQYVPSAMLTEVP